MRTAKIGPDFRSCTMQKPLCVQHHHLQYYWQCLSKIFSRIYRCFFFLTQNLTMFGVDIIVEKGTGHHVVIDINYFPGKCSWYMLSTV